MEKLYGIESEVARTIKEYNLIEKSDNVVVALSGGKDSTSVLYILHKLGFKVQGLLIDLHLGEWSKTHNEKMTKFCDNLGVPLTIVDLKKELGQGICFIKAVVKEKKNLTGCSVCGTIKRWLLNKWAKKLGADKLATGHNLDDEAQNVLMNFLKGNIYLGANTGPSTGEDKVFGFAQRIKPLFFIPESRILKYAKEKKFDILYDRCPCAFGTYRTETREWMKNLTDEEKMNIVVGFQKIVPKLREKFKRELFICERCGEPSSKKICNFCEIIDVM